MQPTGERFVLFIGESDREGVISKLKSEGCYYIKKSLHSGVANWQAIIGHIRSQDLVCVIAKYTQTTFSYFLSDEYTEECKLLFQAMTAVPHVVFIHETFFSPTEIPPKDDYIYPDPLPLTTRTQLKDLLEAHGLNLIPFRTNADVSVLAGQFVDEHARNLIFRLYVPNGRMWAREGEKLLRLFRDYLGTVSGLRVKQSQYSTNLGVMHEFFADEVSDPEKLPAEFGEFSSFLDLCAVDPSAAASTLLARNIDSRAVAEIVSRYSKEARRLQVDLKQERERRLLDVRHRMEAELVDVVEEGFDWQAVNALVDASIPSLPGMSAAIGMGLPAPSSAGNGSLTVNLKPQIINQVRGIVAQEVSGTQNFGAEAADLLALIGEHGGGRRAELTSAVYELKDTELRQADRLRAKQRLSGFLSTVAGKIGDVSFSVLQSYIEKQMGL